MEAKESLLNDLQDNKLGDIARKKRVNKRGKLGH